MKVFILLTVFAAICFAQTDNCIPGTSRCDGTNEFCGCQNGGLCKPDGVTCNCTTPLVYGGNYCQTPQCVGPNFPNGCINGRCAAPGLCICNPGFMGFDCSIEKVCTDGQSLCTSPACACNGRGSCDSTGKNCRCNAGYAGTFCEIVSCEPSLFPNACNTGKCSSPNVCTCNPGWNGTDCGQPLCYPSCIYGTCSGPNTCTCLPGYAQCEGQLPLCGCDENECLRANDPCDPASTCTNSFGGYSCSACPAGSIGQPYLTYPIQGNITYYTGGCNEPASSVPTARTTATTAQTIVVTTATTVATTVATTAATTAATAATTVVTTANNNTVVATSNIVGNATSSTVRASSASANASVATSNVRLSASSGDSESSASVVFASIALLCFLL